MGRMVMVVGEGGKGLEWNIDGEELKVEAFRYLGMCIDENYEGTSTWRKLR